MVTKNLTGALRKLQNATIVDEKVLQSVLNEISMALLQSDVKFQFVKKLKDNITMQFKLSNATGGSLRKLILSSVNYSFLYIFLGGKRTHSNAFSSKTTICS